MLSLYVMPDKWCLMVGELVHLSGFSIFVVVTQDTPLDFLTLATSRIFTCRSYGTVINRKTILNGLLSPKHNTQIADRNASLVLL